ncbi:MAG: class I adenylate-forming enzyme family protein [Burkholderiales bacterium]
MLTFPSILQRTQRNFGRSIAVRDASGELSWKVFIERIARAAALLGSLGVRRGDRFAILSRNSARSAELMHAGFWLGAVPVPLNYRLAAIEIARILDDADCGLLAIEQGFAHHLDVAPLHAWRSRALSIAPGRKSAPLPNYDTLLDATRALDAYEPHEDDDALILYTGSPNGRGKGVRLSHRNILASAMQLAHAMAISQSDVYLHTTQIFNSSDLKATAITVHGGSHVYPDSVSSTGLLRTIEQHRATIVPMVRSTLIRILEDPAFARYKLSSVRLITLGSSRIEPALIRSAIDAFPGVDIHQCYGLTETADVLTVLDERDHRRAMMGDDAILHSSGRALAGVDLRVVDVAGREVEAGANGEIVVRGPQITRAYHNRPAESGESFRDGWFHTGDVGHIDAAGYVFLLEHKKDVIITNGDIVYCAEVEAVLREYDGVQEAAVIGIADELYGELPVAFIVPTPGRRLAEVEIIQHCRGRIGGYKIPRRIVFTTNLMKNTAGRVLKPELRQRFIARQERVSESQHKGDALA